MVFSLQCGCCINVIYLTLCLLLMSLSITILLKTDGILLYETFNEKSTGAIRNLERFVLSEMGREMQLDKIPHSSDSGLP